MNDPFECLAQVDRSFTPDKINDFRDYIRDAKHDKLDILRRCDDVHFSSHINYLRKVLIEKWAFCALSRNYNDILMWSYYANGHNGMVVGFDFKKQKDRKIFQKVNYKNSLGDFDLNIYADFLQGKYLLPKLLKDISIKAECWKREKEWRLWRLEPGYHQYSPQEVSSVHFGVSCDPQTEIRVRKAFSYITHGDFNYFKMQFTDTPIRLTCKLH